MKTAILMVFAALLLATAVTPFSLVKDFKELDSLVIENQNVTILDIDHREEKVILCVNGKKNIASIEDIRKIGNVYVDVKKVKKDYAEIKLRSDCKNCVIENNNECLHECNTNLDCNDDNESTTDLCLEGDLRKCFYIEENEEKAKPIRPIITPTANVIKEQTIKVTIEEEQKEEKKKPVGLVATILNLIFGLFN